MDRAIQKAAVLIEALPYILEFQGKRVVIKLGGSGMDNAELIGNMLRDIVFMRAVGMHPMIVHGGGPFITRAMEESGAEAVFVHGHRVTDEATLGIVEKVLLHEVNSFLVKQLNSHKGRAAPVHVLIDPFLLAERKKIVDEESGEEVDLGFVGTIKKVETLFIEELCQVGRIPVIAPMAVDENGQLLNVNADDAAARIAIALGAEKLVFFTNVPGVLREADNPDSLISTLHEPEVETFIEDGVIDSGMLPKVRACLAAVHNGVHKAHIVDAKIAHSLLLEIFTEQGIGTQILK